jgi:hypothetical protein
MPAGSIASNDLADLWEEYVGVGFEVILCVSDRRHTDWWVPLTNVSFLTDRCQSGIGGQPRIILYMPR